MGKNMEAVKLGALKKSIGPAMKIVESFTSGITPENDIARFLDENLPIQFQYPTEGNSQDMDALIKFMTKLMVWAANENPMHVIYQQVQYHNKLSEFYNEVFVKNGKEPQPTGKE